MIWLTFILHFLHAMLTAFLSFLQKEQLITNQTEATLLAVSGGVDSVVLCHLFKEAHLPFAIAHCHFNLRGKEADQASQLVASLAAHYQVPYYTTQFETKSFAAKHKISIQMAARTLRYHFFHQLLYKQKLAQIATAHHWDDAVETMLLNLIKGSGIRGLCGIQPIHGSIIRPLLFANKKDIIAYAKQASLTWQEDSSNQALYYQRNFIRHKIIPLLQQINPNFSITLKETALKLNDVRKIFAHHIALAQTNNTITDADSHCIPIHTITALPGATTTAFELVRSYGFTFKQIQSLMEKPTGSGKRIYSTDYILYVDRQKWFICKKQKAAGRQAAIEANTPCIAYANHTFYLAQHNQNGYTIPKAANVAALSYHRLAFPLTLRPWQAGDYFYPLGMQGRKKLSDYLIDLKVAMVVKEKILVLTSNQQIAWVVGYRIDQRFCIDNQTETIFEITLT
ncbi:MAG: tRNA lysidine(34) synthetase TilS [Candidatus Cardinium sp.]|nr:tRNA lysidine(34) synthetase TilS [Candidatus Cardinium sp.]